MRPILTLAVTSMLALSAPAFAQSVGSPGAAPGGSGSNTPGSGVVPNSNHPSGSQTLNTNGQMNNGMSEGRAAAPNVSPDSTAPGTTAQPAPDTARGNQNGQSEVK